MCVEQLYQLQRDANAGLSPQREKLDRMGFAGADVAQIMSALEIHVAEQFRTMDVDPSSWEQPFMRSDWRGAVERAVAAHPSPSPQERAAAAAVVAPFLEYGQARFDESAAEIVGDALVAILFVLGIFMFPIAILGFISAPLLRGGLLLRLVGVGVVTRSGAEVTRARALTRAVVSWALIIPTGIAFVMSVRAGSPGSFWFGFEEWLIAALVIWLAGAVWAAYDPQRGLQDRLAGTHVVPT